MNLEAWALKWKVSPDALGDMRHQMGMTRFEALLHPDYVVSSETPNVKLLRLKAAQNGDILWRNNNGAYMDDSGNFIRYGLANDSSAMNKLTKSSDCIGIRKGGQFYCREIKRPGWKYHGTKAEVAQLNYIELVMAFGGDAGFATCVGDL